MNTLNIYCDASIQQLGEKDYIGSAGFVAVVNDTIIDTRLEYLEKCTNNKAEIIALLLSVYYAMENKNRYSIINIFSDSKICIYGVREWIKKWICDLNGIYYNSSGDEVANQQYFIQIANIIISNKRHINLLHQKGHVTLSDKSLLKAQKVFNDSNDIILSIDNIRKISYYNNMIDKLTKDHIVLMYNKDTRMSLIEPIKCTRFSMTNYTRYTKVGYIGEEFK